MSEEEYSPDDPMVQEFIDYLIEVGAFIVLGTDDNGEQLLGMDAELMKQYCPAYYRWHAGEIDKALTKLYQEGLADFTLDENMQEHWFVKGEE